MEYGYTKVYRALLQSTAIAAPKGVTTDHERELWENKAEQPLSRKNVAQEEREDASLSSSRPTSLARGKAEEGAQPVKKVSFLSNEGRQLEESDVESKVVDPSQNRNQATNEKSENKLRNVSSLAEQKELTKNTERSAENSSKIDVNIKKAPKIQRAKSKEEDDIETSDSIEENYMMLEIPVMPGQSGQSELENYQETDTTWEMIYPDHDDNYCIDQDEAKNVICQQTQTSSTEGNTNDGTLVMKLRMRNGRISFKEKDAVWNEKWRPPDGLLVELSEKWVNVAEAELEIYHVEEKGAIRVEIKDTSKNSLFPAMVVNVYNAVFRSCFTGEMSPDEKPIEWPDSD
ncbi:hypothetical protein OS493_031781 [Desmophyllum pertusum]|uniref:Uncharacterized protein n=1 Tax=Desmophyllum pertusum TaxID=174260 RepID=A0A9X0CVB1_9CNID|nr:hypothetical protein OS493_031781 [Desmophyllum pertusum]